MNKLCDEPCDELCDEPCDELLCDEPCDDFEKLNIKEENNLCDSFEDMNLKKNLLKGIYAFGLEHPSIVQQKAIKPACVGKDIIIQSQSGTGKTATFLISVLQLINETSDEIQALILSPTRELAIQTNRVANNLGKYLKKDISLSLIGGTSIRDDKLSLKTNPNIIIGTSGRIYDLIQKKLITVESIKILIIDEADEMLLKNFQIRDIVKSLSQSCQIILVSATFCNKTINISKKFMRNPVNILVKQEELTLEGIRQFYVYVEKEEWKFVTICDLYDVINISQCVIFCNNKEKVIKLAKDLNNEDFTVSLIHSDIVQSERNIIMEDFKKGSSRILIATDLLARGIDVQQVSLVINYDLPLNIENYIHRIGRSGRFGRKGFSINLIAKEDTNYLKNIEKYYNTIIEELPANIKNLF